MLHSIKIVLMLTYLSHCQIHLHLCSKTDIVCLLPLQYICKSILLCSKHIFIYLFCFCYFYFISYTLFFILAEIGKIEKKIKKQQQHGEVQWTMSTLNAKGINPKYSTTTPIPYIFHTQQQKKRKKNINKKYEKKNIKLYFTDRY